MAAHRRRRLRGASLALLVAAAAAACGPRYAPSLPRIRVEALGVPSGQLAALRQRYRRHPAVFLRIYDRIVHEAREKGGVLRQLRVRRWVVLDPSESDYTTFTTATRPGERLLFVDLAHVTPEGRVHRFGRQDLVEERHVGGRTVLKLVYPEVRAGSVIEERTEHLTPHEARHASLLRNHAVLLQRAVPVQDLEMDYYLPRTWSALHKPSSPAVAQRLRRLYPSSGYLQYHYRRRDVPPLASEPFAPSVLREADSVRFVVNGLVLDGTWRGYRADWRLLGLAVGALLLEADAPLEAEIRHQTERLFLTRGTLRERLRKVLRFTQGELHVAPDGISSGSLHEVLLSGVGSKQQIAAVGYHLLRAAGVPAELLLAHDGRDAPFDRDFVSFQELDEALLYVGLDGRGTVVVPWERAWPIGLAPDYLQGEWAMRVSSRGLLGWLRVPVSGPEEAERVATYDAKVVGRDLVVSLQEVFRGAKGASLRAALLALPPSRRLRSLRARLDRHGPGVARRQFRIVHLDEPDVPLRVESGFVLEGALHRVAGGRLLRFSTGRVSGRLDVATRERPIHITQERRDVEIVTLRFPAGWRVQSLPLPLGERSPLGAATREVTRGSGRLWMRQSVLLRRTWQPPSNAGALQRLLVAADDLSDVTVAFLVPGDSAPWPAVSSPVVRPHRPVPPRPTPTVAPAPVARPAIARVPQAPHAVAPRPPATPRRVGPPPSRVARPRRQAPPSEPRPSGPREQPLPPMPR